MNDFQPVAANGSSLATPTRPQQLGARSLREDLLEVRTGPLEITWDADDLMLYALGVGAGQANATAELELTTENTAGVSQQALATYVVVLAQRTQGLKIELGNVDLTKLVHAQQDVEMHRPLALSGRAFLSSRVLGTSQKRSGTVVASETTAVDAHGAPLFSNRSSVFLRGLMNSPDQGELLETHPAPPDRTPDLTVQAHTRNDQALLYRLCGDRNPLHSDPEFARRGGFDRPILHGMCTYGITARLLVGAVCAGEPSRLRTISGRFTKPVMPGATLTVRGWSEDDHVAFQTLDDAGDIVIDRGSMRLT